MKGAVLEPDVPEPGPEPEDPPDVFVPAAEACGVVATPPQLVNKIAAERIMTATPP